MNNDDTRPADTSGHTAQSEQSEAAAAITRSEFDTRMEAIMAVYKEVVEQMKQTTEEMKQATEQMKQTDVKSKETSEQFEKISNPVKETFKRVLASREGLGLKYCEVNKVYYQEGDSLDKDNLVKLLEARGFEVTASWNVTTERNLDGDGYTTQPEYDIMVRTDSEIVVFKVKRLLYPEDVKRLVAAMKRFARIYPEYASRKVYGGFAFIDEESDAGKYAAVQGLYVIRETGYSASIVNDAEFTPVSFKKNTSAPVGGHLRLVPDC